jgi:glutamate synthase domain-containing protein 1
MSSGTVASQYLVGSSASSGHSISGHSPARLAHSFVAVRSAHSQLSKARAQPLGRALAPLDRVPRRLGKAQRQRSELARAVLAILRTYWRLARPEHWLFPDREASKPISVQVLYIACAASPRPSRISYCLTLFPVIEFDIRYRHHDLGLLTGSGGYEHMCGIVGLFGKSASMREALGEHLSTMLVEMTERGPDSAGVALYRERAPEGAVKVTLRAPDPGFDWPRLTEEADADLGLEDDIEIRDNHAVLRVHGSPDRVRRWFARHFPEVHVVSQGREIEIFKDTGLPATVVHHFGLRQRSASHGLGHTRMATESAVTTAHSHPFSTGLDLCLVHNGSLSNHNRLRARLARQGIEFQTDNDSEVAAGYLTYRLQQGDSLEKALMASLQELDGFFTFAVGTIDGFAVLRDPIGCKHAVLAETDDWVAMATEYRAIAGLPGANEARAWEPVPGQVYSWSRASHARH